MEVSIHAVSPESSFGAAGAAGAGACAAADSVSSRSIDVASISRCKTRYADFINFPPRDRLAWANRLLIHEPDALPAGNQESCQSNPRPATLVLNYPQPPAHRS